MSASITRRDVLILSVFVSLFFLPGAWLAARIVYEEIALRIAPTAERAYWYGERHFDARHSSSYDINRAKQLFLKAESLNPNLPYVQHQLARVAFLEGDFQLALSRITVEIDKGNPSPSSFYIRGLILGFMGRYDDAAKDYEEYLRSDPTNWAAINDYAWVLLKADRPLDALTALDWGLMSWPENPWLLNSRATALFELHQPEKALESAQRAGEFVTRVSEKEWLQAYPGNDPLIAGEGVATFQRAVEENIHKIAGSLEEAHKDVQ